MIKAETPAQLADHIERFLDNARGVAPGSVLADATEEQMRMIVEALRRPPVTRSTAQG